MKKRAFLTTMLLCFGVFSFSFAKSDDEFVKNYQDKIEKMQEKLNIQIERMQSKMEKHRAQVEKKIEKRLEKFDSRRDHFSSTTAPIYIEVSARGNSLLRGVIENQSNNSLMVRSWGGLWTVNVSSTTILNSINKTLTDFKVGDYVGVQGQMSTTSTIIDAKLLRDRTE